MSLIPLLDRNTLWGRRFSGPPGILLKTSDEAPAACWVLLGQQPTRPHHACLQKLCTRAVDRTAAKTAANMHTDQPANR